MHAFAVHPAAKRTATRTHTPQCGTLRRHGSTSSHRKGEEKSNAIDHPGLASMAVKVELRGGPGVLGGTT